MKKIIVLIFLFLIGFANVYATHNRAGEITYQCKGGFKYGITVTTYTNTYNTTADRCELTVLFGDGDSAIAPRINPSGFPGTLCPNTHDGVMITSDTKFNQYYVEHIYSGSGTYVITMEDPNRNASIQNIPNSVNQSFFLRSELVINPWLGCNSSPVLQYPPIDDACVGECFVHNPGADDSPENDSLYYSLTTCYGNGQPIFGYSLPTNLSAGDIDPLTGDLVWCSPTAIGMYNVAILIKEYRKLPGSPIRYYIGSVLRDMQITVASCTNTSPVIKHINDTCVVAGTNLNFNVSATDAQPYTLSLFATGGPFNLNPAAAFTSTPSPSPVFGAFSWTPNCNQVRLLPYSVTFKVTDGDPSVQLVDFESVFIKVIAPSPTGLTASPSGASITVDWNDALCNDTLGSNPLVGYYVYRKDACDPWLHNPCETGVPSYTGYTLVGSTGPSITSFVDNNYGQGLVNGVDYSYIIVAYYADGSQSYASTNICAQLVRDVPIITNVSVMSTGANDSIYVHWVKPLATGINLDTVANPPPYEYHLMKAQGFTGSLSFTLVATYSAPSFWQLNDSSFINIGLNTKDSAYTYRVDFYSNGILKGSSHTASSIYLSSSPSAAGNTVDLTWREFVPWTNYQYYIYRETSSGSGIFNFIDSSATQSYADTGLVNGANYCYKVVSVGQYSDPVLPRPLYNSSQIKCETPIDIVPPCQPRFNVNSDCGIIQNVLTWTNPNTYCSTDAVQYNVYFSPTTDGAMTVIHSTSNMNDTTFTHIYYFEGIPSVAGCYAVTAVDSFGNESPVITKLCVDNCPVYELPNVFTPNGDNINDWFIPLPYRYVKDIDIKIYDRWGLLMFSTKNPDILWDGKNADTKSLCSDGTYYYVCVVNEIRVEGIKPRVLKGFVQLINDKTAPNK